MKTIKERFTDFFKTPPLITESSTLSEIEATYPELQPFIERKYGLKVDSVHRSWTLRRFVEKFHLPPAQILFMEIQLAGKNQNIREISSCDAAKMLDDKTNSPAILDVRESWELKFGSLPGAKPLTPVLLDEILRDWDRSKKILLYCHFGIRSMDAAHFLLDRGFQNIFVLKGGIDSWAKVVDPNIPQYTGAYC